VLENYAFTMNRNQCSTSPEYADVAIKALNYISGRLGEGKAIPTGSTYKIRNGEYYLRKTRVFPSYLQAGPSFFIEKSKRRMIAEDISAALGVLVR